MEQTVRSPKELASIIEEIITKVNKKFKFNRNAFLESNKEFAEKIKQSKKIDWDSLSPTEVKVLKLKHKQDEIKKANFIRKKTKEFRIQRELYLKEECENYGVSFNHIMNITGFNLDQETNSLNDE